MIHDKLKEIRETTGMNKKEFAQYLGMKYTTYNNYETGAREPSSDFLILISTKFDVSVDYILGTQDEKEILHSYVLKSFEFEHIKKYRNLDDRGKSHVNSVLDWEMERMAEQKQLSNHIGELKADSLQEECTSQKIRLINYYYRLASAGTGQIIFDMPPSKRVEIPDIPKYRKVDYAIGVNGNSMEPEYYDGDMLLIEMVEEINLGEIGIFLVDGESYVKKLGKGKLISLNPEYANIPLDENSRCMGRVVDKL